MQFTAALAEAGKISEARAVVDKAMQLEPKLSIGFYASHRQDVHESYLKSLLNSLRKAGVPE